MNTPSPASIGLGMALMVRPRLCLGAALTTLGETTATSMVTAIASTAKRGRIWRSFPAWCGVVCLRWIPAPYQAAAMNDSENTASEAKLRYVTRLRCGGPVYPRCGGRPGRRGARFLAARALLPGVRTGAVGASLGA